MTTSARRLAAPILVLVVVTLPFWVLRSSSARDIVIDTFIFMMATVAWNIISGFGGQVSFGHSIFFGIGAYSTVLLFANAGVNTWLALVIGVAIAALTGAALGALTFRLRGIYFSLATFTLTLTLELLATHFTTVTGGAIGESVPLLGNDPAQFQFDDRLWFYYLGLACVVVFATIAWRVRKARLGYFLRAVHDDETAARASGVPARWSKVIALVLSAGLTAVAGGFYVQSVGFIDPASAFGQTTAIQIALLSFVGGVGTLWGPIIGAGVFVPLQQALGGTLGINPGLNLLIYGGLVLLIISVEPRGLVYLLARDGRIRSMFATRRPARSPSGPAGLPSSDAAPSDRRPVVAADPQRFADSSAAVVPARSDQTPSPAADPAPEVQRTVRRAGTESPAVGAAESLLSVENVTVQFGGLRAVDAVSLGVGRGELLGIVGPNGAGKTTLFNVIAGAVPPTSGGVRLSGRSLRGKPPEQIARLGLARTFQNVRLFQRMTIRENILVAAMTWAEAGQAGRCTAEIIELLDLGASSGRFPRQLPLAQQKKAEIGRALALRPTVLLLDEMMSGLNEEETAALLSVVLGLNADGLTVVVIEHVLRVIFTLTDRVVVLDHGALIAEGRPHEVMRQPRVVEAYLGKHAVRTVGHG